MFICKTQLQQLPPFLIVGFIVIVDFLNQRFCESLQQSFALQYLFNSFLIHRFCAKVATPAETAKTFSNSQGIPG